MCCVYCWQTYSNFDNGRLIACRRAQAGLNIWLIKLQLAKSNFTIHGSQIDRSCFSSCTIWANNIVNQGGIYFIRSINSKVSIKNIIVNILNAYWETFGICLPTFIFNVNGDRIRALSFIIWTGEKEQFSICNLKFIRIFTRKGICECSGFVRSTYKAITKSVILNINCTNSEIGRAFNNRDRYALCCNLTLAH